MRLPGQQDRLAEEVLEAAGGKPVIVVLNVGSPKDLPWVDRASAILLAPFGGEMMACAVVQSLLGTENPAGRLPMTWPRRLQDAPAVAASQPRVMRPMHLQVFQYKEGLNLGYRAYGPHNPSLPAPLFHFGHGLSYTSFTHEDIKVTFTMRNREPGLLAQARIYNEGATSGAEVLQLYVGAETTTHNPQIPRALRGFQRTAVLMPRESETVDLFTAVSDFAQWYDTDSHSWRVLRPGTDIQVEVGKSSADVVPFNLELPDFTTQCASSEQHEPRNSQASS